MKKRYLRLVRRTFRALRHRKLRHRVWWQTLTKPLFDRSLWVPCRDTVANGLAIGLFFSLLLIPMQSIFAAIVSMRAKANVPFAVAACLLSNPLTNVPIWIAQAKLGRWLAEVLSLPVPHFIAHPMSLPGVGQVGSVGTMIIGMIASGVLVGLCAYPIVHLFSALLPHHLPVLRRRPTGLRAIRDAAKPS
jgi:uncharacterized protein